MSNSYYVYILTNFSRSALYIGITNDLIRRVEEHRSGNGGVFTRKYSLRYLVYFETTDDVYGAITREKELKGWRRQKKDDLIESSNPARLDLYENLF